MIKEIFFILFVIFVVSRSLITRAIPPTIYTIIIFLVPLFYFTFKRHYHLFYFNMRDTPQSIGINLIFSIGFIVVLILIGFLTNNNNWILLLNNNVFQLISAIMVSFFQEMLFRYFIQRFFVTMTNSTFLGIIITSIISGLTLLPSFGESIVYLFMGLVIGYIFEKTKDIYGATLANFLISSFARVMV